MKPIKKTVFRDFTNAESLDNFRLDSEGSLVKREGYSLVSYLGSRVRGAVNDYETSYFVSGYTLYRLQDGTVASLGSLNGASFDDEYETVYMFIFKRCVYIMGGGTLYSYNTDGEALTEITGYTPLIRKNSNYSGTEYENYEVFNIINSRVQVHYNCDSSNKNYILYGKAASVTAVYLDGKKAVSTSYTANLTSSSCYITFNTYYLTGKNDIVIEYELDPSSHTNMRNTLFKRTRAIVYEHEGVMRMLIYGGNLGDKVYISDFSRFEVRSVLATSKSITTTDGRSVKTFYDFTSAKAEPCLDYFTSTGFFSVGYNGDPVRAIERLTDHYMLFTKSATFHAEFVDGFKTEYGLSTSGIKACMITDEYGIGEMSGVTVYEDSLYFYNENGLYKYSYNKLNYDFIATRIDITEYAAPERSMSDKVRLFLYRRYNELWCCYDGYVSVYSLKHKLWYRFSGIDTDVLFCHDTHAAMSKGGSLYIFDESSYTDGGIGFEAVYESKNYDLGSTFSKKNLYGFGACFDKLIGSELDCTLTTDKGDSLTLSFTPDPDGTVSPTVMQTHARLSEFGYVRCRLVSPAGRSPANVREIMFRFREIGRES